MQPQSASTIKLWKIPYPLSGHLYMFGRIGSGKSTKMLTIAQAYHSIGYKIWDIFGGKRGEGPFWSLKNDDDKLWEIMKSETYEFTHPGPKEYKVNLLYPMFTSHLPKTLPTTLPTSPRVKSKVFTIPVMDVIVNDIKNVLGEVGSNSIYAWETLQNLLTKSSAGKEVDYLFDTKLSKYKHLSIYKLFLKTLIDNHTLSSKDFDLNLDFIEEAKDKETISVLCLDYVPERFRLFIMGYLQRKIRQYLESDKIHKKNIAMYRESSLFMKIQDSSGSVGDSTQVFRNQFSDLVRYGRDGFYAFVDTQSPAEVKGLVSGQEDILGICEMPSPIDRETLCKPLKQDGRMSEVQIKMISTLPIHQICVVLRRERARILKRISPPRCRYWKEGRGNFYTIWKKEIDSWRNIVKDKDLIRDYYREEDKRILVKKMEENVGKEVEKEAVTITKPTITIDKPPIVTTVKKKKKKTSDLLNVSEEDMKLLEEKMKEFELNDSSITEEDMKMIEQITQ